MLLPFYHASFLFISPSDSIRRIIKLLCLDCIEHVKIITAEFGTDNTFLMCSNTIFVKPYAKFIRTYKDKKRGVRCELK